MPISSATQTNASNSYLLCNDKKQTMVLSGSLLDNYYGSGYHDYGSYAVDLSSAGYTSITFYVAAVPNRFKMYDSNNTLVWNSGWLGNASYSGPWGQSISTGNNPFSVGFSGGQVYHLNVETSTNTDPYNQVSDHWDAFW